jgi:hypothetical protein
MCFVATIYREAALRIHLFTIATTSSNFSAKVLDEKSNCWVGRFLSTPAWRDNQSRNSARQYQPGQTQASDTPTRPPCRPAPRPLQPIPTRAAQDEAFPTVLVSRSSSPIEGYSRRLSEPALDSSAVTWSVQVHSDSVKSSASPPLSAATTQRITHVDFGYCSLETGNCSHSNAPRATWRPPVNKDLPEFFPYMIQQSG